MIKKIPASAKPLSYNAKVTMSMIIHVVVILTFFSRIVNGQKTINFPDTDVKIQITKCDKADGSVYYQIQKNGINFGERVKQLQTVHLKAGPFNPVGPQGDYIDATAHFHKSLWGDAESETFIVQLETKTLPEYKRELKKCGVTLHQYIPDYSYVATMDPSLVTHVRSLPFVRWIGNYLPAYRLDKSLYKKVKDVYENKVVPDTADRYVILLIARDDKTKNEAASKIENTGGKIIQNVRNSYLLQAKLTPKQLSEVIKIDEIAHIELSGTLKLGMDIARYIGYKSDMPGHIGGANYVENVGGYTGQGVRGAVLDEGLYVGHPEFQNYPPIICLGNSPDDPNTPVFEPDYALHGTSVFGILFASGEDAGEQVRGMLPDAQGIFTSYNYSGSFMGDRTDYMNMLINPNGPYKTVFQSNSFGSLSLVYSVVSNHIDQVFFDNDILGLQCMGNAGNSSEPFSFEEAWCKNVVSVGGIYHYNTLNKEDDHWYDPNLFMASYGPCEDGRVKPDLCNFFDLIHTTGALPEGFLYREFAGTSGATPITAGHFGLMFQMWADGVFNGARGASRDVFYSRPHAATAKAIVINMADQYPFSGTDHDLTRAHQGWGMPDIEKIYNTMQNNNWHVPILVNEDRILNLGDIVTYELTIFNPGTWLRATLVYSDPPPGGASSHALVNKIFIRAVSPSGAYYFGNVGLDEGNWSAAGGVPNTIDNVQNIFIQNAESGSWIFDVVTDEINADGHVETPEEDADYALIVTTGGINNSKWQNKGLSIFCDNRERLRINDNGDVLIAGDHEISPFSGLKFSYAGTIKSSIDGNLGHFISGTVSNPDRIVRVNPLPVSTGVTITNAINGNSFQVGNDGVLKSNGDNFIVSHAF